MELSMASPYYYHMNPMLSVKNVFSEKVCNTEFSLQQVKDRITTLRMTQIRTCIASNYFINEPLCMGKKLF